MARTKTTAKDQLSSWLEPLQFKNVIPLLMFKETQYLYWSVRESPL